MITIGPGEGRDEGDNSFMKWKGTRRNENENMSLERNQWKKTIKCQINEHTGNRKSLKGAKNVPQLLFGWLIVE